jgi:hypothetical protein
MTDPLPFALAAIRGYRDLLTNMGFPALRCCIVFDR